MAGKKLVGKTCVYCAVGKSTPTGDHVIARSLVLVQNRAKIPTVPCCEACNKSKSRIEHYLASVLPFGNRQANAAELLAKVDGKLSRNEKLRRQLASGSRLTVDPFEGGGTIAIPFDAVQLLEYSKFVATALLFLRWQEYLPAGHTSVAFYPTIETDQELQNKVLRKMRGRRYEGELANRALSFDSLTSSSGPLISVWRFEFFDGLVVSGDDSFTPFVWAFVGPPDHINALTNLFS